MLATKRESVAGPTRGTCANENPLQPLVAALQVACSRWALHWSLKWAMILAVSLTVLLLSYQYLVRYSFIGRVLNGPRQRGQLRRETVHRPETNGV